MIKKYNLMKSQMKIYKHQKLYKKDSSYNLTFLYEIEGEFDAIRFKKIAELLMNNLDLIKVNIAEEEGEIVQIFNSDRQFTCNIIYNKEEGYDNFCKRVVQIANEHKNTPINLEKWPLLTWSIFSYSRNKNFMLISIPHIISDVYSCYFVYDEICKYYNSDYEYEQIEDIIKKNNYGKYLELPELLNQNNEKSNDYFEQELKDIDTFEISKIKQKRNVSGLLQGKCIDFVLGSDRHDLVKKFITSNNISEFSFFFAIHSIVLNKIIEEDKFIIGVPLPNRIGKSKRNIFGYFVNTLPNVVRIKEEESFINLCQNSKKQVFNLIKYQDFDISLLNQENISGTINNMFTYIKQPRIFQLDNCKVNFIKLKTESITVDLTCLVENIIGDFNINLECSSFFDEIDLESIYINIIDQVIKNADIRMKDIIILDNKKLTDIYGSINQFKEWNENTSIKDKFEEVVDNYGDRIALDYNNIEWTYKYLDELSNRIARWIMKEFQGVERVAISLERNNYLIAVILGIIKSGKTYVPIDLIYPQKRVEYILNDLENIAYIGTDEIIQKINIKGKKISLERLLNKIQTFDESRINNKIDSLSGAYMIYTSGSTGNPKGVIVSNKNLLSLLNAAFNKFQFKETDIWTLFHSYGFDFSVWEIFGCMLSGGKLVIVDSLISKSPREFYNLLNEKKVTILSQTPTAFKSIIDEDNINNKVLNLRYVIFGGEALYFSMLKPWVKNHSLNQVKLVNMYGITETTIHVTYYEVTDDDIENNDNSVIGVPLNNVGVFIINKDLNIVPNGIAGEIAVFGDGVTNGYYNRIELTDERFVNLKIMSKNIKVYRSGDLGKIDKLGRLEYMGRMDKQVQLRGFRIELGEIENVILRVSKQKACVVDIVSFGENDDRLIAYIVPELQDFNDKEIKQKLKEVLPDYMIPTNIIKTEFIPTTVNGKVDYMTLRNSINKEDKTIHFSNNIESKLYEIIADKAKNYNFTVNDNFFDIGINSIHLASIYYEIQKIYDIQDFNMMDLFQYTTISKLVEIIENRKSEIDDDVKSKRGEMRRKRRCIR